MEMRFAVMASSWLGAAENTSLHLGHLILPETLLTESTVSQLGQLIFDLAMGATHAKLVGSIANHGIDPICALYPKRKSSQEKRIAQCGSKSEIGTIRPGA